MSKIGIAIQEISGGAVIKEKFNEQLDFVRAIRDWRQISQYFNVAQGERLRFLTFLDSGCLIGQHQPVADRGGDCIVLWIFLPDLVDIQGEQIVDLLDETSQAMQQPQQRSQLLAQIAEREYPQKEFPVHTMKSTPQGSIAWRAYKDDEHLARIIGPCRYQTEYAKYSMVVLIDEREQTRPNPAAASRMVNLSQNPLREPCLVISPSGSPEGFMVTIEGSPITWQKKQAYVGDELTLVWHKPGWKSMSKTTRLKEGDNQLPTLPVEQCVRNLQQNEFKVCDQSGRQLSDFTVLIDNKPVQFPRVFRWNELQAPLSISVKAPGFKTSEAKLIDLKKNVGSYMFSLKPQPIRVDIDNYVFELKERQGELRSPLIPGYDTNDGQYSTEHINYLQRKSVFPYKYLLIGVAIAFLIGLFIPAPWGWHGKSSGVQNGQEQDPAVNTDGVPNPTPDPSGTPVGKTFRNNDGAEQPQAALNNSTSAEGIKTYLTHNNAEWVKDSLLRYEPIGDSVWDAFARFDRDKIKRLFPRNYDKIGNGPKINNLLDLVKDGSKWQQPADGIYQNADRIVLDNWYNKCCKREETKSVSTTPKVTVPAAKGSEKTSTPRGGKI